YNCCADTSLSFPMKILSVWFPNIFTPDAGDNNLFGCHTSHDVEAYELVIFNRWGLQLWSTNDINQGWDGRRADGTPCPQGAYVYHYYLRSTDGTFDNGIGTVTLLR
ncbi:MAG: gliding motility-associated C-terminal domain-containing protein, partial [Bacteroidales bacterium]|nr:gliding motility-associated C-terminal domain-containing protein [Bacteroidales bacterium]